MSAQPTAQGEARVPFVSLASIQRTADIGAAIDRVIRSGRYILGAEVVHFEEAFARYCGVERCVAVANGTDALEIALRSLEVGPGARVLVVANAGHYGSTAVRAVGATPEYVDIDEASMNMSPAALSTALAGRRSEDRPAAIIVTHLYGRLAGMEAILAEAARFGVPVIEDCAQAHGAARGGVRAGGFATIGCFSFYPTKNLGAVGDGGAIVTHDGALADRARSLRQYGWDTKYHVSLQAGRNSRMDEIQAAVLNDRLVYLDEWNEMRRAVARAYRRDLAGLPLLLTSSLDEDDVAHLFVARVTQRDRLREHLAANGIDSEVHYPVPDHLQPAYAEHGHTPELPVTEAACASVLSLPCYPGLGTGKQARVTDVIGAFFADGGG